METLFKSCRLVHTLLPIVTVLFVFVVNAGELWDELRNDSRMKLLKEDSTISPELKVNLHFWGREEIAVGSIKEWQITPVART